MEVQLPESTKALVVDDSKVMRRMLVNVLTDAGVSDILQAANGDEALASVQVDESVALVLMDWNMPGMDGLEAVKAIRELGRTMPIIMVTSEADRARIVTALKAGANNYIIKPFDPPALLDKIKKVLSLNLS